MIPSAFDYHAPTSVPEAIALLTRFGDSAKVISGGQSLLPLLKLRLGTAEHLVDIGRIAGLEYVREEGGFLRIGGRTREAVLERSAVVQERYPILADTARVIADPLLRNRPPVGGNPAHGDPAAEDFLVGKRAADTNIAEAARRAAEAASPTADRRGSVEYKREMARVLAARALKKAVERAGGR